MTSQAEGVVEALRAAIMEGRLRPGDRLVEATLVNQLDVSRNTLREAFRVLAHDQLVEHRPNRGVVVRLLTVREATDVYRTRRMMECGALRDAAVAHSLVRAAEPARAELSETRWQHKVTLVRTAVDDAYVARTAGDWFAVGSANGRFHLALAGLADNAVVDRCLRTLLSEMRLLFVVAGDAQDVHDPYVDDNAHVCALVEAGEIARASIALESYLLRAERSLVAAYAAVIESSRGRRRADFAPDC